jgi:hypothetical protein
MDLTRLGLGAPHPPRSTQDETGATRERHARATARRDCGGRDGGAPLVAGDAGAGAARGERTQEQRRGLQSGPGPRRSLWAAQARLSGAGTSTATVDRTAGAVPATAWRGGAASGPVMRCAA